MINSTEKKFHEACNRNVFDENHKRKMTHALNQAQHTFQSGIKQFVNVEKARELAREIKNETIANLDKYLLKFEGNFTERGGKVIWARDGKEALEAVWQICREKKAKNIVKSKSMVTEEIHLNKFLIEKNLNVIETDLGEYIQQLAGEPPYHITAPSIHKSKEEVANLFHEKLGVEDHLSVEQLTKIARFKLRKKFEDADVGITGANFLLADIGGVAITENEGNARLVTAFPRIHIAITGIEKVLPSVEDLSLFWPLLASHGSGQRMTVYNSIYTGPKRPYEHDGPEEMYIILLDNGRTNLLSDPDVRESLNCIKCGACLNICPVYKNIGGHAYGSVYSGPIGSVITPHLSDMEEYSHLSNASSLCGACTEVCPVKINLHGLLLANRQKSVALNYRSKKESFSWIAWKHAMLSRKKMNLLNGSLKEMIFKLFFRMSWLKHRDGPSFPKKSFNQQWREMHKRGN